MNELAKVSAMEIQPREISASKIDDAIRIGEIAWKSGICKASSQNQAAMIMMKGYELGFPMTACSEFIQVVEGSVGLTPRGALAIMRAHPEIVKSCDIEDLGKDGKFIGCRCTIVRHEADGEHTYQQTFTLEDAKQAGLVKPNGAWEKYPRNMCRWRAIGFCADLAVPDLLSGMTGLMKQPEAVEPENFSDVEIVQPEVTLADLMSHYSVEEILAANDGRMPDGAEECKAVLDKLKE